MSVTCSVTRKTRSVGFLMDSLNEVNNGETFIDQDEAFETIKAQADRYGNRNPQAYRKLRYWVMEKTDGGRFLLSRQSLIFKLANLAI